MEQYHHNTAVGLIRVQLGLTQQQLADSLGVSRSLLSMVELGKRSLPQLCQATLMKMDKTVDKIPVEEREKLRRTATSGANAARAMNRVKRPAAGNVSLKEEVDGTAAIAASGVRLTRLSNDKKVVPDDDPLFLPALTREEYIALLKKQWIQKETLEHQLQHMLLEREAALVKGKELGALLQLEITIMDTLEQAITGATPGRKQKDQKIKHAKLYYKRLLLERQLERYDAGTILLREQRINTTEGRLRILNEYIHAVERRIASPG
jgi:transcriptional regulator with XRE-family HTH domain